MCCCRRRHCDVLRHIDVTNGARCWLITCDALSGGTGIHDLKLQLHVYNGIFHLRWDELAPTPSQPTHCPSDRWINTRVVRYGAPLANNDRD